MKLICFHIRVFRYRFGTFHQNRLLGCHLFSFADPRGNIRRHEFVKLVGCHTRGQNALNKAARKQRLGILKGHTEILCLALDLRHIQLGHHLGDQRNRALTAALTLDLQQQRRVGKLLACIAQATLTLVVCGGKCQVQIQALAHHVDTGKHFSAALIGFALPACTRAHAAIGKKRVFDVVVIALQLLARLNVTGKEGSLVTDLDGSAFGGLLDGGLAQAFLLLGLESLALDTARLLLGGKQVCGQDLIRSQRHLDGLAHQALVLGKLFAIVH